MRMKEGRKYETQRVELLNVYIDFKERHVRCVSGGNCGCYSVSTDEFICRPDVLQFVSLSN